LNVNGPVKKKNLREESGMGTRGKGRKHIRRFSVARTPKEPQRKNLKVRQGGGREGGIGEAETKKGLGLLKLGS